MWGLTKLILARTFENSIDDMFLFEGLGQVVAMGGSEFDARLSAAQRKEASPPSAGDLLRAAETKPPGTHS